MLGCQDSSLRKINDVYYQLKGRIKKLLKMPESFFSENTTEKHEIKEEQLNEAVCECLIAGFMPELSKFVAPELGYYHSRINKMVRFGYGSVYRPRGDTQVQ